MLCACRLRHVPLVNRRFSELCRDPEAWPELHVLHRHFSADDPELPSAARWRSFLRWLTVRAAGLESLVFGNRQVRNSLYKLCLRFRD